MKKQRRLAWLIALGLTATLFVCCFAFLNTHYAVNDDAGIQKAFLGYETGTPARFHMYIHGLLALPLSLLGSLAPTVAWFSYLQITLLFLGCVVIAKSLMQCALKHKKPLWQGAVLAAAALGALCVYPVTRVTFTQTAAVLGAAAVLQILSIDHGAGRRVVAGMAGALALVVLAYALRQVAALPILGFCGLAFVYTALADYGFGKRAARSLKPLAVSLALVVAVMGGMAGWRALETAQSDARAYLDWQQANTPVIDFIGVKNLTDEQLAAVGWSPVTRDLLNDWCFLDSRLTTESFEQIAALARESGAEPSLPQRLQTAVRTICTEFAKNRGPLLGMALAVLALLLCVIFGAAKRRWLPALTALLAALLAGAMLLYLALGGRLPLHAMLMALLPGVALILGLMPACLPQKTVSAACAAACAACAVLAMCGLAPQLAQTDETGLSNPLQELEECALYEPDSLFIYDYTLVGADLRLFPDYSEGVPHNVAFWGGWGMRSPESMRQFAAFGIDLAHFDPATFLRDDVYLASGRADPPPMLILNWLRQEVDEYADVMLAGEYSTLYLFQFY